MTNIIIGVVAALIQIESCGNDAAVGDNGRAVGCLQLWPIAVAEANRVEAIAARSQGRTPTVWSVDDRTNRQASVAMAFATLRWHYLRGVTDPIELGARWRNPKGDAPEWYVNKLRKQLK